jgi:hypothetical protein
MPKVANDNDPVAKALLDIARRLANIEAILTQERKAAREKGVAKAKRNRTLHDRLRREADRGPQPTERHFDIAKRLLSR